MVSVALTVADTTKISQYFYNNCDNIVDDLNNIARLNRFFRCPDCAASTVAQYVTGERGDLSGSSKIPTVTPLLEPEQSAGGLRGGSLCKSAMVFR